MESDKSDININNSMTHIQLYFHWLVLDGD
jgi:hypothetical protein